MILVTGATGFIGKNFVLEQTKKTPLKILVRRTSNINLYKNVPDILIHYGDLLNDQGLDSALKDIDIVIHCAAKTMGRNFYEFYQANVIATENLIKAMKRNNVNKILFLSSQSAGGPGSSKKGLNEISESVPVSFYGLSKKMAEDIIINSGLDYIILRPCSVYGPYDLEILKLVKLLKKGFLPIIGRGEKYINLIYVKDLISLMQLIIEKKIFNDKLYYVSDGICYSFEEVVKEILKMLKKVRYIKINIPESMALLLGMINDLIMPQNKRLIGFDKVKEMSESFWVCESSNVFNETGWIPNYDFKTGMEETLKWYKENNYLKP